ncbi:hypothetical protein PLEI_4252 [Photobacterium leiognathi lrivu.4.1]|uniref:Uncharacterized protein n=1 Tax=Photobacterium leiognathi lrivu.4.1 TaxID=1248232 RepID=V5FA27_PHOLE|nr:hypothetical protein PLEI_4252 [Photobacterium leiognathi lrivu.4.1]
MVSHSPILKNKKVEQRQRFLALRISKKTRDKFLQVVREKNTT